MGLTTLNT